MQGVINKSARCKNRALSGKLVFYLVVIICLCKGSFAQITPEDVLLLVNENSPTSRYIAKLYRTYHPNVSPDQVVYLQNLTDCSNPDANAADEIITRQQYDQYIAEPVRNFLITNDLINEIKVIITTAGMPYRIEDTDPAYKDAIYPGGSDFNIIANNISRLDIASVESELTCLWYSDYGDNPFGLENRMVNVYQGYRQSSISLFEKNSPGSKQVHWEQANTTDVYPKIEGYNDSVWPIIYGAENRSFNAGDIYLVSRLDGPKNQGQSAVHSVRAMLERAKRASDKNIGVNPDQAAVIIDDAPNKNLDRNRVYNLDGSVNYLTYDQAQQQPPDAIDILLKDDFTETFTALTNSNPTDGELNINYSPAAYNTLVLHDHRSQHRTSQSDLDNIASVNPDRDDYQGIIALATYGYNGDEGSGEHYLLNEGPSSGKLFNCVNGAVFTSIESFNALTMFSDVSTQPAPIHQGKIVDFIEMGGTGAIGHAFEPISDAIIDNLYLHYNLLADQDSDAIADLSFIEAAYSAIPYLSWSEVVIGDPLMRISYGPGGKAWTRLKGDANNDGWVTYYDYYCVKLNLGGKLHSQKQSEFEKYNDLCDINKDGAITYYDFYLIKINLGAVADWK